MRSFITTSSTTVVRKPAHLNFEEAVTIPVAFVTAHYALHSLGRLAARERVLIQAGAGGVGLAAIQIAQLAGADVFATAGSREKRQFLEFLGVRHVMNSRSLAFAEEVMEVTGGEGVDLVLNSLAGDAIPRGLSCLAPSGRFVELGTRDIYQNTRLGLRAFKNGTAFMSVGPGVFSEKPELVRSSLDMVLRLFMSRELHPLPYRVFPLGEVRDAFRHMAQAKHVGKIVLSFHDGTVAAEPRPRDAAAVTDGATYLLTGGLGGFGLATAEWLVSMGARHLMLVGRSGRLPADAPAAISRMEARGAVIRLTRADVTSDTEVRRVLGEIQSTMPPLRGVIHSAMVLDDGILLQLTPDRFRAVMHPKVLGAWNLHRETQHLPLDFFLLYSSVATLAGNPGQGSYVAANVFLDALAHHRRRQGLPALSVAWGHVSNVGYVARNAQVGAHLDSIGLKGFSSSQALQALARVMGSTHAQIGIMKVDWRQWFQYAPAHGSSRFSLLMDPELASAEAAQGSGRIREAILAAPSDQKTALMQSYLAEQVARVLGMSPSRLDPERPLNEMGLDSLMMMELKNRIEKGAGVSLTTVELLRGPSLVTLTRTLLGQVAGTVHERPAQAALRPVAAGAQSPVPAADVLSRIETLPEEEVDELLKRVDHENELRSLLDEKARK